MKHLLSSLALTSSFLAPGLSAQDLLYYRFDENYGTKVINYAAGSPAPTEGTLTSNLLAPSTPFQAGRFGTCLTGAIQSPTPVQANYITTGWNPGTLTGSLSAAMWLRLLPTTPNPSLTYLFGNGTLRLYSGSGALLITGWNAANTYITSKTSIFPMAKNGWVHVALVLDGTTLQGTYYVNGVAEVPSTLPSAVAATGSAFYVGSYNATSSVTSYPCVYDIDDFVFANRAFTPAEIAVLAAGTRAGDAGYGGGCGGLTLASTGGAPSLGNVLYQLTLTSSYAGSFSIGFGSNRASLGGIPLPFDLGLVIPSLGTCYVDSSLDLLSLSGVKTAGTTPVGLPIPSDPAINGLTLYLQTLSIGGPPPVQVSNAFSIGVGN